MMDVSKTRVNFSMLAKQVGQYVCVVGKNLGVGPGGMSVSLETSDGQKMEAHFPQPMRDPLTNYVELVGKVNPDLSLAVERVVSFGSDFDLEGYDKLLQLSVQFPQLFSSSSSSY